MIRSAAVYAFVLAVPSAAAAQPPGSAEVAPNSPGPLTAEAAIDAQRGRLQTATGTAPCPRATSADEILVCGRRGVDPNRVPVPDDRVPGERVALLRGEPPSPGGALAATAQSPCSAVGRAQHCAGGLPVVGVLTTLFKIGKHLLGGDD